MLFGHALGGRAAAIALSIAVKMRRYQIIPDETRKQSASFQTLKRSVDTK